MAKKSKRAMWHDDIADEAADLINRAEQWRFVAGQLFESLVRLHDETLCVGCRVCDSMDAYREARRG